MVLDKQFISAFRTLPRGSSEGLYEGRKYGLTIRYGRDDRQAWLYAEELGGNNHISCNIYFLKEDNTRLKPCEMPAQKVIDFVLGFVLIQEL